MNRTESHFKYAQVLVDLDAKALDRRTFSYEIPEGMEDDVEIGSAVSVSFGRMNLITGYVVGFSNYVESGIKTKSLVDILDEEPLFDLDYLQFLDWVAQYYATPLITVLSAALPSGMIKKTNREAALIEPDSISEDYIRSQPAAVRKILLSLKESSKVKGMRVRYLVSKTGLPLKLVNQTLYKLRKDGIVTLQSSTNGAVGKKSIKWVRFHENNEASAIALTKRQSEILELLATSGSKEITLKDASLLGKTSTGTLQKLALQGAIEIFDAPVHRDRDPLAFYTRFKRDKEKLILNSEQEEAYKQVLKSEPGSMHLLYGVTGSGKTEVYLALTEEMLNQGKSVLVLVPEISLTSHIAKRFIEKFGMEDVVLWHSHLSAGEKVDSWRRIHRGELRIVIGARSAIFTPVRNLGLIVMDEEHEGSFKQENPAPRYHAKTLAAKLVERSGAKLLLGSATPAVESFWQVKEDKSLLYLTRRYGGRSMADVTIVDMRKERSSGRAGALSASLQRALEGTVAAGEQAIILLNRRGFHTLISCNNCGEIFQCSQCSVALTYHRHGDKILCHYCGYEGNRPEFCPECASFDLHFSGMGTQRLEEEISKILPQARILRLDSDIMKKKFAYRDVFEAFAQHEADILIGTQMVAKGLDIPNVTLVGVVSADAAFFLPDYKSSERGFQLLTQVAGRSGRGDKPGKVIIQSFQPHHTVIVRAKAQDYEGFYHDELARRQEFDFPPYSQLFRMIATSPDEFMARNFIKAVAINLRQILAEATINEAVTLLGPAPCVISRIQGRYRFHLIVKNRYGELAHQLIAKFYNQIQPPEEINFLLDIDSQSFL